MRKTRIYTVLLFFVSGLMAAQNGVTGNPDWQIKPSINTGFILVHHISIGHLVKGYPALYAVDISKPSLGNKIWQLENNMPDFGVSLQCIDFRNPSQLGYGFVVAPFVEIPLNEKVKASRVVMRLCWGASYLTKKFDIADNHKNIAIGSNLNAFVQFRWLWHLQLTKNLRFEPGITFSHCSNGRYKNPNLGLNVVSLNAGFNYLIRSKSKPQTFRVDSNTKAKSKNELLAFAAIGFNQREIYGKEMQTYVVSVAYQRNVRNTHKFSAGVDVFYDQNYQLDYKNELNKDPEGLDKVRIAARIGYSYNIGRISLPIEMGYYVFQKAKPDANVVTRLGVRYYTKSGLMFQFGLRTHFAVAYNFEYGIGYRFCLK